ncbi:MAG: potassium-transporting ATPase subunit KdpC [Rhodanobacteraceae bacterium]
MNTNALSVDDRGSLRASVVFALIVLLGYGFLYELAGTALGRLLFAHQAQGSLIEHDGHIVGSSLIAQPFADPRYFQPRPSAAGYDPMAAAGSNQARSNPKLRQRIADLRHAVARRDGIAEAAVPGDLVTESGSGLDPDLSPEAVRVQIARVAKLHALSAHTVETLVREHTTPRQFGALGEPRVNVLELNLALDALAGTRK